MAYRPLLLGSLLAVIAGVTNADEALRAPVVSGDMAAVRRLLDAGTDVTTADPEGAVPLHWAVHADQTEVALALLDAGAAADATTRFGVTPLYLAAVNGNAELTTALLAAGADASAFGPNGETMLMTASRTGRTDAMAALLDAGADVDVRDPNFEQTALMIAVRERHIDAVELLLARGADVDARTVASQPPAFVPPCKGTGCGSEGVGINRGGLPDRGRRDAATGGLTPLLYAARDGLDAIAGVLIAAGADLELAEANGVRPLLSSLLNGHIGVARQLVDAGADLNADDFWGRTPLWAAVEYRNLDMNNNDTDDPVTNGVDRAPFLPFIEYLLQRGADPDAQTREVPPPRRWLYSLNDVSWVDFTGQTPFLRAALSADTAAMQLLLEHGADPNLATQAGTTPLMAAAGVNWVVAQTYTVSPEAQLEAVQLCLSLGADINAVNSMGLSALLGAVNRGSNHIVRYLAHNGADLRVIDVEGRDAIRWAEGVFLAAVGAERKAETIELLEQLMNTESGGTD